MKINVDGSYYDHNQSGGWGFVIKDENGVITSSRLGRIDHCSNALQVEGTTAFQALAFGAMDAGMLRIYLKTDAENLKTTLRSPSLYLMSNGVLFHDLKFLMFIEFICVQCFA
jgi:ribonuclease HI